MICDMCGTKKGPFFKATIEGTEMSVCNNCMRYASHAQQIKEPLTKKQEKKQKIAEKTYESVYNDEESIVQVVNPNFGKIIKEAREKRELKQVQLANQLAIKESILHSIESGKHEPDFDLLRKFEKHLRVSLIEQVKEKKHSPRKNTSGGAMTIADMLKK